MSSPEELNQNDAKFIHDNLTRDNELLRQLNEVLKEGDVEKVLAIFELRRVGFQRSSELARKISLSIGAQAYVNQRKAEMETQYRIYIHENSMKDQITGLISRIEKLESNLRKVKE